MVLEVNDHRKEYRDVLALESLNFRLEPGGAIALLGPNGAGKSTAIRILVSLEKPDRGSMLWNGENLFENPGKIRDLVGYVSQEIALDKMLTGLEFMRFTAGLLHLDWKKNKTRALDLLEKMDLMDAKDRQVGKYSGGMKRRLDLAAALLKEPQILILDEPTTGLDIEARELIWNLIKGFLKNGGLLILASHDFREVGELANEVLILDRGSVLNHDTPTKLKDRLGSFIVRVKTREFMEPSDIEVVKQAFAGWQDKIFWQTDDEFAAFAYRNEIDLASLQTDVNRELDRAGLNVYSANIQKPNLEDVYRFSLGGFKCADN